ncbi:Cell wall mannoprotein 1 [Metarhizium brunneum]|uniref:Cell wall mannoprotein 1 n=1 Tax=Metarhizium brunneum TaxID=500148 RepID=A0A7D5Z5G9_9HYPO
MKFLLFASTALALIRRQGDVLSADVAAIVTSVTALQARVNEFQGAAQADALIAASKGVVAAIKKGTADARASPSLSQDEAFSLVPPLQNLIGVVNKTVGDLVTKKHVFADSGRGCEVYPQLVEQKIDSQAFSDALVNKVPEALKGIAGQISAPILKSLADGAAAFKDVECAATSTGATQSSTISVSSTVSSAGSVTTTGGGTSVSSPASTSGAQTGSASGTATEPGSATGTKTPGTATGTTETGPKTRTGSGTATATASESCGETTTVQVPVTETVPCTTTGGSGSHPTGGPGSQPSSGSGSQPTGGSGPQPTGGSGCPGCAPGQTSPGSGSGPNPTGTLVPIPSGGEGGHGGSGGNGGSGGSGGSGAHPSPSSPVIVAGAPRGEIPLAVHVAMAAIVGAVGAAL